jgi:UDP:flavonoid glycosyltransferase YjiC (YdhE family)
MRVTILVHGTRGDVYPLTALAAELARRGYQIRLAASVNLVDTGRRLGLDTVPIAWDSQQALESQLGQAWVNTKDGEDFVRLLYEIGQEHGERLDREVVEVCQDSQAIVSNVLMEWRAAAMAEARGIPLIVHDLHPRRMNDVVPHPLLTTDPQPDAAATEATYREFARMNWRRLRAPVNRFRRSLELPAMAPPARPRPLGDGRTPEWPPPWPLELQAYSPSLVPGLKWDAYRPFVGDLRMSRSDLQRLGTATLDTGLAHWLDAGEPPAFFTFGSTYIADPAEMLAIIGRVCRSFGLRGLVVAGWGLAGGDPTAAAATDLKVVPYVDYDVVLPRCALVVHHGGNTITAAAIRAGLPSMVCSSCFDQPFWGIQLERLGVGTHVRHSLLTEDALHSGIRLLMTEPVRKRAALLGQQLRAEPDGTLAAADEIDQFLAARPERGQGR